MSLESKFIYEGVEILSRCTGKVLKGTVNADGYRVISFKKEKHRYHRVKFYFEHGYLPDIIDHIDGNRLNNDISNLREATYALNSHNTYNRTTRTGCKGVYLKYRYGKWRYRAKIVVNGKGIELGLYDDLEQASKVYKQAAEKYYG